MSESAIDLKDVMERVQGDKELLLELFDIFEEDYQGKRVALDRLMEESAMEKIRDIAHSLKGAAGNIAAKTIYTTCADIEQYAERKDLSSVKELIVSLDQQFGELQKCTAGLRKTL